MNLEELVVSVLAVWRVASLLAVEDGPLNFFRWLRKISGIEHDENGIVFIIPERLIPRLVSCVWCNSVWVGAVVMVGWKMDPELTFWVLLPLALSAGAILVNRALGR